MVCAEFRDFAAWPFQLTPDPGFFFAAPQHEEILDSFRLSRSRGTGFRVLTGEIGAGKTMLFRMMRSELQASGARVAEVVTSNVGPGELLTILTAQFGIAPPDDEAPDVSAGLRAFLAECHTKRQRVVVFIDEAQNLPLSSVETLYPLVDLAFGGQPALEIFLLGQPELGKVFDCGSADEAGRRVVWNHHLRPLQEEDTRGFILHRLKAAGWCGRPAFAADAYRLIHRQAGGVPRRIVILCNRLLVLAKLESLEEIDGVAVRQVLLDAQREGLPIGDVIDTDIPTTDEAVTQRAHASSAEGQDHTESRSPSPGTSAHPPADLLRAVEKEIGPPGLYPELRPEALLGAVERALGQPDRASERRSAELVQTVDEATEAFEIVQSDSSDDRGAPATLDTDETRAPVDPASELGNDRVASKAAPSGLQLDRAASRRWLRPMPLGLAIAAGFCFLLVANPVEQGGPLFDVPSRELSDCPSCPDESDAATTQRGLETPGVSVADPVGSQLEQAKSQSLGEARRDMTSAETQDSHQGEVGGLATEVHALDELAERLLEISTDINEVESDLGNIEDGLDGLENEAGDAESSRLGGDQAPEPRAAGSAIGEGSRKSAALKHPAGREMDTETSSSVSLSGLVLTRRIVNREPSGTVKSFSAADRLAFVFVRLNNPGPPTEVSFVWYRDELKQSIVKAKVGRSRAWRTWSSARLSPGTWRVDVLSPDGSLIGEKSFIVAP